MTQDDKERNFSMRFTYSKSSIMDSKLNMPSDLIRGSGMTTEVLLDASANNADLLEEKRFIVL
jgi:hypothetical protein